MPIHTRLEHDIDRWLKAGVIDPPTASRIRAFEGTDRPRLRWQSLLALAFGGVMLAAGTLLFVAAHWDAMSPGARFASVLALTALFHVSAAAAANRFLALARVLHALGTVALGASIFLTAQIFNLQEHWPSGVLLWAVGATLAYWLLRDWVQGLLTAVLVPAWLISEWLERVTRHREPRETFQIVSVAIVFLALAYFTSRETEKTNALRRGLMWIGGIALLPATFAFGAASSDFREPWLSPMPRPLFWASMLGAALLGLVVAYLLTRRPRWELVTAAAWILLFTLLSRHTPDTLIVYPWAAASSIALVLWGLGDARQERINLGVAGFALTAFTFYFSSVMDKLDRSLSLIVLGLLFLLGGWLLERTRRKLVAMTKGATA